MTTGLIIDNFAGDGGASKGIRRAALVRANMASLAREVAS